MDLHIRASATQDYERVLDICISAFTPYHRFLEGRPGRDVFDCRYRGWRQQYSDYLAKISDTDPAVKAYDVADGGARHYFKKYDESSFPRPI